MTLSTAKTLEYGVLRPPVGAGAAKALEHNVLLPPPGNAMDCAKLLEYVVLHGAVRAAKALEYAVTRSVLLPRRVAYSAIFYPGPGKTR